MGNDVLITGVSTGLGRGLAEFYSGSDCSVYGISRKEPVELTGESRFHFSSVDLKNFSEIKTALKLFPDTAKLDLVILNAGILGQFGDMAAIDVETMREVLDVNLWANKIILDCIFEKSIEVNQVVAISSGASVSGARGWNAYGISKAALNMMMKMYAAERPNCHFCSLAPGLIDSSMQDYLCTLPNSNDYPVLQTLQGAKGTKHMPKPAEAAQIIADCISKLTTSVKSGAYADVREFR